MRKFLLEYKNPKGEVENKIIESDGYEVFNNCVNFFIKVKRDPKTVKRLKLFNEEDEVSIYSFKDWISVIEMDRMK